MMQSIDILVDKSWNSPNSKKVLERSKKFFQVQQS